MAAHSEMLLLADGHVIQFKHKSIGRKDNLTFLNLQCEGEQDRTFFLVSKKEGCNKLLEIWNRSNAEEESIMVEEKESQQNQKLAHSIEEILRRPTCVKKETRILPNFALIKENTRTSTGIVFLALFCIDVNRKSIQLTF